MLTTGGSATPTRVLILPPRNALLNGYSDARLPVTALWINNPGFDTDHRYRDRGGMLTKTPPPTELQIPATITTLLMIGRIAYWREGDDGSAQRGQSVIYDCHVVFVALVVTVTIGLLVGFDAITIGLMHFQARRCIGWPNLASSCHTMHMQHTYIAWYMASRLSIYHTDSKLLDELRWFLSQKLLLACKGVCPKMSLRNLVPDPELSCFLFLVFYPAYRSLHPPMFATHWQVSYFVCDSWDLYVLIFMHLLSQFSFLRSDDGNILYFSFTVTCMHIDICVANYVKDIIVIHQCQLFP